jgi:hypothetical protein
MYLVWNVPETHYKGFCQGHVLPGNLLASGGSSSSLAPSTQHCLPGNPGTTRLVLPHCHGLLERLIFLLASRRRGGHGWSICDAGGFRRVAFQGSSHANSAQHNKVPMKRNLAKVRSSGGLDMNSWSRDDLLACFTSATAARVPSCCYGDQAGRLRLVRSLR